MTGFINATLSALRDHWDVVMSLAAVASVMAFLEVRLNMMFARHEMREKQMYAEIALTAETAGGTALEAARHISELQTGAVETQSHVANLSEQVKMHDRRLGAIEERYMRAALTMPRRTEDV